MGTPAKTQNTDLIVLQSVASAAFVIGSAIDVSTKVGAMVGVKFGRRATTALTVPVIFRVEISMKASGDGHWHPYAQIATDIATSESEAATGTNSAGQKVITCASTTNLVAGDVVFIDNTTIGNSEWGRIASIVASTSITLEDNLTNAQNSGAATIYDQAQIFAPIAVDLTAVGRIRCVVDNSGSGQAIAAEVKMVTWDSY